MKTQLITTYLIVLLFQGVIPCLSSQDNNININDKEIKLNNDFKLEKSTEIPSAQDLRPLKGYRYKEIFNELIPKDGVEFYSNDKLSVKYENSYYIFYDPLRHYQQNNNYLLIGFFFKAIDDPQKAKDIIYSLYSVRGRIVESKIFYDKYIEEIENVRPDLIVNKTVKFQEFTAEFIDSKYYNVKLTLFSSCNGLTIEQYIVDMEGHITYIGNTIVTKGILILSGALGVTKEESIYYSVEEKAVSYSREQEKKSKLGKSVFYSVPLTHSELRGKNEVPAP